MHSSSSQMVYFDPRTKTSASRPTRPTAKRFLYAYHVIPSVLYERWTKEGFTVPGGIIANYEVFRRELDASFERNNKTWRDDGYAGYYLVIASSYERGLLPEDGRRREKMDRDLKMVKKALKTEDDPTWFEIHRARRR